MAGGSSNGPPDWVHEVDRPEALFIPSRRSFRSAAGAERERSNPWRRSKCEKVSLTTLPFCRPQTPMARPRQPARVWCLTWRVGFSITGCAEQTCFPGRRSTRRPRPPHRAAWRPRNRARRPVSWRRRSIAPESVVWRRRATSSVRALVEAQPSALHIHPFTRMTWGNVRV